MVTGNLFLETVVMVTNSRQDFLICREQNSLYCERGGGGRREGGGVRE